MAECRVENGFTVAGAVVMNQYGMYTRVCARIVQQVSDSGREVYFHDLSGRLGDFRARGGSILELLMLGAEKGVPLEIAVEGVDQTARELMETLVAIVLSTDV